MRLVLDTNVLVAALISHGQCHELLEHAARQHDLWTSEIILGELNDTLQTKFKVPTRDARIAVELLRSRMNVAEPSALSRPTCRDPDDDLVLATVVEAEADCLITGDGDLQVLESYEGVPILSPSAFWAWEDQTSDDEEEP